MHFYEDFLGAYDPKLRELRGVYYTPEPVVSYIVRSVDRLLRDEFGLADGLADTGTVEVATEDGEARTSPRVLILDPAAGTGTFLREVVSRVRRTIADKGLGGAWPDYVREHLLPRLFGFELLMAPYVICHLKLAIEIGGDQGAFAMPEGERLNVFLTNSLEEAREGATGPMFAAEIAREAREADAVKCDHPVMVVIGNPPYSGHSANRGEWIRDLIGAYKQGIPELRKPGQAKWLSDDYVKFIRFAQWRTGRPASRETRRIEATTGATCAGDCSPPSQPLPKPAMRPHRRGTRPADPERERLLRGKRRDRGVLVAVVLALEAHGLASPEAGRDLEHLVGLRAGPTRPAAGRDPLGRDLGADAEGWQQPPVAEEVDRRALHREHQRVAQRQDDDAHPELEPIGRSGERGHRAHRLELRLRRDQPVGLPDRVDVALLAEFDPLAEGPCRGERERRHAKPDARAHRRSSVSLQQGSRPRCAARASVRLVTQPRGEHLSHERGWEGLSRPRSRPDGHRYRRIRE